MMQIPELDKRQGEIFLLYVVEGQTREDVLKKLKEDGLDVKPSQLRDKLHKWGYRRYIRRSDAMSALFGRSEGEDISAESSLDADLRHAAAIERTGAYWQNHSREHRHLQQFANAMSRNQATSNHLGEPERPLQAPTSLRAAAKFQFDLDELTRQSFQIGDYRWQGNGLLIVSSTTCTDEKTMIQKLIHNVDLGCDTPIPAQSQTHFEEALEAVDQLVQGQYHENIPNILAKINDLNDRGFPHEALRMKMRAARSSHAFENTNRHIKSLYHGFKDLELEHLAGLETRCLERLFVRFEHYAGPQCYSSFVKKMDLARRTLALNSWRAIDDCLPCLCTLDELYGKTNCRPLDVLRIRIETLYLREARNITRNPAASQYRDSVFDRILLETQELIDRAQRIGINNDPWQFHYFLIKGHYYAGLAQNYFKNKELARKHLEHVLELDRSFRSVDRTGQFDGEVTYVHGILQDIVNEELSMDFQLVDNEMKIESWELIDDSAYFGL